MKHHSDPPRDPADDIDTFAPLPNQRLNKIFNQIGDDFGIRAEDAAERVLTRAREEKRLPPWILRWTRSVRHSGLDKRGVDFQFETTEGVFEINIKSSVLRAEAFLHYGKRFGSLIVPVVVNIRFADHVILGTLMCALVSWHIRQRNKIKK